MLMKIDAADHFFLASTNVYWRVSRWCEKSMRPQLALFTLHSNAGQTRLVTIFNFGLTFKIFAQTEGNKQFLKANIEKTCRLCSNLIESNYF